MDDPTIHRPARQHSGSMSDHFDRHSTVRYYVCGATRARSAHPRPTTRITKMQIVVRDWHVKRGTWPLGVAQQGSNTTEGVKFRP